MYMQMIHVLPADPAGVHDGAEAVRGPLLAREPPGEREHVPQHRGIGLAALGERVDVALGDDHEVHRRLRVDVVEGEHLGVLVDLAARDLAFDDLAEDAVAHHSFPFEREAFSSSPERPSRRSSSASTSSTPIPCHASITRQWNQRSAVSWTIAARSPDLAASTVSVASSPIFLRMASWPRAFSDATYEEPESAPRRAAIARSSRSSTSRAVIPACPRPGPP